jgi:hypothetical protein
MKMRNRMVVATVIAALFSAPRIAAAQSGCGVAGYTFSLGLGGSLMGCFTGTITELGEDAGAVSDQFYWAGNFAGRTGPTNAPTVAGTFMFDNGCGSGGLGTFAFCTGPTAKPLVAITNPTGELVLGLRVPDNTYGNGFQWVYSGASSRGDTPLPEGFQAVLLQLTANGVDDPGQFLFGWEDLNSGCTHQIVLNNNRFREEDLGNGVLLNTRLSVCDVLGTGGNSDSDFNDSYMRFSITGTGRPLDVVPEPMTMTLMAFGLVGLAGTSIRRRFIRRK